MYLVSINVGEAFETRVEALLVWACMDAVDGIVKDQPDVVVRVDVVKPTPLPWYATLAVSVGDATESVSIKPGTPVDEIRRLVEKAARRCRSRAAQRLATRKHYESMGVGFLFTNRG